MLRFIACFIGVTFTAMSQPAGAGVIGGTIVLHGSGEPVRKAVVVVNWQGAPRAWATVQTDGSGRFRFDSLPPGQYSVTASKEGSGSGSWGSDDSTVAGRLLTLTDGEHRTDLQIRLVKPAIIMGVVAETDGDPLPLVDVQLLREGYPRGAKELIMRAAARTNDRGEYRFANVEPGKVYIAAQWQQGFATNMVAPGEQAPAWPRQFFRGTTDWRRATPVLVRSGEQIRGIDIRLGPAVSYTVRGRVRGLPPLPDVYSGPVFSSHAMVHLSPADDAQNLGSQGSGINAHDGTFAIGPVPPGRYWLMAEATVGDKTLWASEKLDIRSDAGEINLALLHAVALKGAVAVEGESPVPLHELTVELTPGRLRGRHHGVLSTRPQRDGSFVFPQVPPGIWDINVKPIARGGYIKSMRLGDQDVLTEEMEIGTTAPEPLNIVVSSRGAKISGELAAEAGKMTSALIILAPESPFQQVMSFYTVAPTKQDGKFELMGITPGKYRLYAVEMLRTPVDPRNPELLGKLKDYSELLDVKEGAVIAASPKVIPAEKFQEAMR